MNPRCDKARRVARAIGESGAIIAVMPPLRRFPLGPGRSVRDGARNPICCAVSSITRVTVAA